MGPNEAPDTGLRRPVIAWSFVSIGALGVFSAFLLPPLGESALRVIRGRDILAPAAREILDRLLLLAGATAGFTGALFLSTGLLLRRRLSDSEFENRSEVPDPGCDDGPPAQGKPTVLLLAIGFVFAATLIAGRSFSFDEILQFKADVTSPLSRAIEPRGWVNHISGTLLARIGLLLFGASERALRLPAVIVSTAGLTGLGLWLLRQTRSVVPSILAMLAVGGNALVLEMTVQIRGYSPLIWFGGLTIIWGSSLTTASHRSWTRYESAAVLVVFTVGSVVLGLSHLFGLFYLCVFTAMVHGSIWLRAPRGEGARVVAVALACATSLSLLISSRGFAWLLYGTGRGGPSDAGSRVVSEVSILFLGRPDSAPIACLVAGLSALSAAWIWRFRPALRLLAAVATVPLWFLLFVGLVARPVFFHARFLLLGLLLAVLPPALALGAWLQRFRPGRPARIAVGSVLAVGVISLYSVGLADLWRNDRGYREALRDAECFVAARARGQERRIVPAGGWESKTIVRHYLSAEAVVSESEAESLTSGAQSLDGRFVVSVGRLNEFTPPSEGPGAPLSRWELKINGPPLGTPICLQRFGPR